MAEEVANNAYVGLVDEAGNGEDEKSELDETGVSDDEIDDLTRKILTVSATSFAFAGLTMGWLNSNLARPLPGVEDSQKPGQGENDAISPLASEAQRVIFEISPKTLQMIFISLATSAIGVLLGLSFITYQISLCLREMKSGDRAEGLKSFKRLRFYSTISHVFLCFGVFLGFLSVAFAVLLFHNFSMQPFLGFLLPLIVCTVLTAVLFYFL